MNAASTATMRRSSAPAVPEYVRSRGKVRVLVKYGTDLAAMDSNGSSDPYAVVQLGDQRMQTKTHKRTLCPEWNQSFDFEAAELRGLLELKLVVQTYHHRE